MKPFAAKHLNRYSIEIPSIKRLQGLINPYPICVSAIVIIGIKFLNNPGLIFQKNFVSKNTNSV